MNNNFFYITLICVYLLVVVTPINTYSQTLTWNNQPNPLEFEKGKTLLINTSYNTSGNTFNYIWIKLQKRNASNQVLEEYNSTFFNGTTPVPNQDTVNITYNIPQNISSSNELLNGEYYYLFFTMWSSNTWTSLDLRPIIKKSSNDSSVGGTTNVFGILNAKHVVGNIDTFDRSKFITIHSNQGDGEWDGDNEVSDLRDHFLNGYDVYMGRTTGSISWHLSQLNQDENNPGFVDGNELINRAPYWRDLYDNKTNLHQYESRNSLIIGAQLHPFWTGEGQKETGKGWKFANATATGDYMGRFVKEFHSGNGVPKPDFIEVINEPAYERYGGPSEFNNTIEDIAIFHNEVADAIKTHLPDAKVGGFTTAFPNFEKGDFKRWDNRWKLFMDIAGEKMDFWSIHLYDWPSIGGRKEFRSGGNVEATFDMMEQYSMLKFGVAKPFVISEYGAQMNDYNSEQWSSFRDWLHVRSSSSLLMSFMDRPHLIASAINFIIVKAEWGLSNDIPYNHRLMRKENEPNEYTGKWVYTDMAKFYKLWSDVKGTRIDTYNDNLDIQIDGFVNENKAYFVLNNLNFADEAINLNILDKNNTNINAIRLKQVYSDGTNTMYTNELIDVSTETVTLKSEATMILEYTFDANIQIDETATEEKYYALGYLKPITSNTPQIFNINGVNKSTFGEAVLRIGVGRPHDLKLKPTLKINGNYINVPDNWRGDNQSDRERFFGLLEIPVPFEYLNTNNQISIQFPDDGGHISTATMQVYNFSNNYRTSVLSTKNYSTSKKTSINPNPTNGIITIKNLENYHRIDIYSTKGNKVLSFKKSKKIDISSLAKGIYILKADNGFATKIMKK